VTGTAYSSTGAESERSKNDARVGFWLPRHIDHRNVYAGEWLGIVTSDAHSEALSVWYRLGETIDPENAPNLSLVSRNTVSSHVFRIPDNRAISRIWRMAHLSRFLAWMALHYTGSMGRVFSQIHLLHRFQLSCGQPVVWVE
jgi:hypothetical protein